MAPYKVAILTVSDTAAKDASLDKSGPLIQQLLTDPDRKGAFEVVKDDILADDMGSIREWVETRARSEECDWILTTGGTGFGARDATPEAIAPLIERAAPGLVHLLLSSSIQHTPMAALSRPIAGLVHKTLVITLPGSPKAVRENLSAVFPVIEHALELLKGGSGIRLHKALGVESRDKQDAAAQTASVPSQIQLHRNLASHAVDGSKAPEASTHVQHNPNEPIHVRHSPDEPIKARAPALDTPASKSASTSALSPDLKLPQSANPPVHPEQHHHHHHAPKPHTTQDPATSVASRHRVSPFPMISFEEALDIVLKRCKPLKIVTRKVDSGLVGHVLAQDVIAAENIPRMSTTNVDGYALDPSQGPGTYKVVTAATHPLSQRLALDTIMRVNTGAPLPYGADAVIMVEDTKLATTQGEEEETVTTLAAVKPGENVRRPGSDVMQGEKICEMGEVVGQGGGEVGTLAFMGQKEVKVFSKPVVAILSSGNEIVDLHSVALSSKVTEQWSGIYDTNRPGLKVALEGQGYEVIDLGIVQDTVEAHVNALKAGLEKADIIVTTGGTSMGATDLFKPVIENELNGSIHFGRVAIKPGKPTTFATVPVTFGGATPSPTSSTLSSTSNQRSKPIFALPGNPASAIVMFWMFVLPALRRMGGYPRERCGLPRTRVTIQDDMILDPRPEFHRVIVRCTPTGLTAFSTGGQRSSRVASLADANAFVALPAKAGPLDKLVKGSEAEAVIFGELRM